MDLSGVVISEYDSCRFWDKVDKSGPDECWLWTGSLVCAGYGNFYVKHLGKWITIQTHRVAFFLGNGKWANPCTLHKCDVRGCCNPAHLYEGTKADNHRDMTVRGRSAVGEKNGNSRLDAESVAEIRARHRAGAGQRYLAREYGVRQGTIANIVHMVTWRHL